MQEQLQFRHLRQILLENGCSVVYKSANFSDEKTQNAMQEQLQLWVLVSFQPNELGNTKPGWDLEHESSYSDHSLDIYVISY